MAKPSISLATVIMGPVLTAGSISRLIKIMGVREPTREARETASIIPVPTTTPNRGSVFNKKFAERLIMCHKETQK